MSQAIPAPDPKRFKLPFDRHTLAKIAVEPAVLDDLLRIQFSIHTIRSTDYLLKRFLELIFASIPAARGAILLYGRSPEQLEFTAFHGEPFKIDINAVAQLAEERDAIMDNGGRSLLWVPLRVFLKDFGAVYLESPHADAFTLHQFYLLIAGAVITSVLLENTLFIGHIEGEKKQLLADLNLQYGIVGNSPGMRAVYAFIGKVAANDATALILGKSGTGKELVANGIHRGSARSNRPFIAVNCGAIAGTLVESELFGAEKGAFTGATERKIGKVEAADKGTLFLDEVGEMPLPVQAALLRVLQEREFQRVGGTHIIKVDVRVIAATNRDLAELVREGRFREDLYYRLKVVDIRMPSLAERPEDIPALTDHFIQRYRNIRTVNGITPEVRRALAVYPWPGNVRELQNAIVRALVMGTSDFIQLADLPAELTERNTSQAGADDGIHSRDARLRQAAIEHVLKDTRGNVTRAAAKLGVSRSYLHRQMAKLGMQ